MMSKYHHFSLLKKQFCDKSYIYLCMIIPAMSPASEWHSREYILLLKKKKKKGSSSSWWPFLCLTIIRNVCFILSKPHQLCKAGEHWLPRAEIQLIHQIVVQGLFLPLFASAHLLTIFTLLHFHLNICGEMRETASGSVLCFQTLCW